MSRVVSSTVPHASPSRWRVVVSCLVVLVVASSAVAFWARGRGYWTRLVRVGWPEYRVHHYPPPPTIVRTRPADREDNVLPDAFIAADVDLPNIGKVVDGASLSQKSVRLYRSSDRRPVPAVVNTSGAGDAIVLRPMEMLEPNTRYTFEVNAGVKDTGGHPFAHYQATFITAAGIKLSDFPAAFDKVALPVTTGKMFTCVTFGPDHKLYASTITGSIFRWNIRPDGTLDSGHHIETVMQANGGPRLITGITFDPSATANDLKLWVSHGQLPPKGEQGQEAIQGASDWTGKISLLSGPDLESYREVIERLPRATKDHLNNQMTFGPDGALYFCQASNTAMGAPDHKWGYRPERLLTAAILRLDVKAALDRLEPIDVKTEEGYGYNPFAPGAPLTIYATGVRNSYDLVWHSNGHLYAALNGSAAGGNTPCTPTQGIETLPRIDAERGPYKGPDVPALMNVSQTEDDFFLKIEKGRYYGHPNPTRAEYVLNGGNLARGANPWIVSDYPPGTQPDRNWTAPIYSFGKNLSPCGGIEYKSDTFGGVLEGKLLYVRYSGGDDIIALGLGPDGEVAETLTGIEGFNHFVNPVDLTEDPRSGALYVAEFGGKCITLLRPMQGETATATAISHHVCRVQLPTPALSSGR